MKKYILILLCAFVFLFIISNIAYAEGIPFNPQISIPNSEFKHSESKDSSDWMVITPSTLGKYIKAIYTYAIGIVGIFSTVVIIYGGLLWAMAGGNNSKVDAAKGYIGSALTGLVLALVSYTLLYMINPALVELKPLVVTKTGSSITCCDSNTGSYPPTSKKNPVTNTLEYSCNSIQDKCTENQACVRVSIGGKYECAAIGNDKLCSGADFETCTIKGKKGWCDEYSQCQPCITTGGTCGFNANYQCCGGDCLGDFVNGWKCN
ncbi:hypothetical protein KAR28_03515 [Candidatus Parcubacteria bacterium]|nr:hypothetical protein [Candidatus Parcubacteria bacterium]